MGDADLERILAAVKAMTDAVKTDVGIPPNDLKVLMEVREQWSDVKKDIASIKTTGEETKKLIVGNGDPSKGLVQQFALVKADVDRIERLIWLLGSGVILAMIKLVIDLLALVAKSGGG
jgi:hypothetical protein